MNIKDSWLKEGFVNEPTGKDTDIIAAIKKLKKEKNAVIMAHYYQKDEVQDIADVVGDSLVLAQKAADTDADIILLSGVHFMGVTA
jgi:quinolinate synthase